MPEIEVLPKIVLGESLNGRDFKAKDFIKSKETREALAFLTSQFLSFAIYMSVIQLFPLYLQQRYEITEAEVLIKWGVIVTAYTFTGLFARIPSGWFIEKVGRKVSVISSYFLMIISVGCLVLTNNTAILALLFVFLRLTNNIFGLASRSLLADLKSSHKGMYNSLVSSFGRFGSLVGSIGLGFILEFLDAYFMILVAFIIAIIGLISFRLLFVKGGAETIHFIRRVDVKSGKKEKFNFKIFKSGTLIFFITAFILFGLISGVTDPIISLYGKNVLNLSEGYIGTLLGLSQLSFILVSPIVGWLISNKPKLIDYLLILSSIIIMGNYIMMFFFYDMVEVYIAALFIKNIAHVLFFPVVFTILTYDLPKAHFSILYSIITTGFFLGTTGTSFLSTYLYGLSVRYPWLAAWIVAAVLVCLSIAYLIFKRLKSRKPSLNSPSTI
ncbi:MAG: MFS transporter [Candidatus Heimdallarchaeota archaeon]|nr:MFS transporter [Candidatus Heimdallarchaeota archaeon]